jgi:hypothetical protein
MLRRWRKEGFAPSCAAFLWAWIESVVAEMKLMFELVDQSVV